MSDFNKIVEKIAKSWDFYDIDIIPLTGIALTNVMTKEVVYLSSIDYEGDPDFSEYTMTLYSPMDHENVKIPLSNSIFYVPVREEFYEDWANVIVFSNRMHIPRVFDKKDINSMYPKLPKYNYHKMKKDTKGRKKAMNYIPKKVIFNKPATIVFWEDGTKTVVKCSEDDEYSEYFGFLAALAKKIYGNNSEVQKIVKKAERQEKKREGDSGS